jgi:hypothetical protein
MTEHTLSQDTIRPSATPIAKRSARRCSRRSWSSPTWPSRVVAALTEILTEAVASCGATWITPTRSTSSPATCWHTVVATLEQQLWMVRVQAA